MGHSPAICLRDYAQVFDEFDPAERKPAEQIIAEARAPFARQSAHAHPLTGAPHPRELLRLRIAAALEAGR
jgi:hypothetical protein